MMALQKMEPLMDYLPYGYLLSFICLLKSIIGSPPIKTHGNNLALKILFTFSTTFGFVVFSPPFSTERYIFFIGKGLSYDQFVFEWTSLSK